MQNKSLRNWGYEALDVKYIPKDWEKMKEGIGDLTGLGVWGKGMIDLLKDITENLERAEEAIRRYDSDGVISFQHTNQKSKYDKLFEDYNVLHKFAGNVGDLVDRTIDDPFYKDMDAFVEAMRDLDISKYITTNRIGATETVNYATEYGSQPIEVKKKEVNIQDLFNADNFYAKQIKAEYDEWKVKNPKKDLSEEDFQKAVVNMHAFKYESIKDKQESKEFWAQIGALVVIVGATIICPPAGMVLGAAYGTLELSSAVSGKDWTNQYEKYGVPFAEELNSSKAIKPNQYIQYPQTGHGFTAAENGRIVPEFESKYLDGAIPTQGEIYVVKDNVEELVGIYDQDTKRFFSIKELPIND